MQIGNSRPLGPKPSEPNKQHLDPDLTRANREGVEYTREVQHERTSAAQEEVLRSQEAARESEAAERAQATRGSLSRETVELSAESRRLAAEELPGPGGRRESVEAREVRVNDLREAHQRGDLNSSDRMREAANRLLGGD